MRFFAADLLRNTPWFDKKTAFVSRVPIGRRTALGTCLAQNRLTRGMDSLSSIGKANNPNRHFGNESRAWALVLLGWLLYACTPRRAPASFQRFSAKLP